MVVDFLMGASVVIGFVLVLTLIVAALAIALLPLFMPAEQAEANLPPGVDPADLLAMETARDDPYDFW